MPPAALRSSMAMLKAVCMVKPVSNAPGRERGANAPMTTVDASAKLPRTQAGAWGGGVAVTTRSTTRVTSAMAIWGVDGVTTDSVCGVGVDRLQLAAQSAINS